MKKLLLSLAILGVMTFAACSDDEKDYTPRYTMCQHCDIPEEEGYEVCTGENGNAYVGNADTGIPLVQYFSLFCDNIPSENPNQQPVYTDCVMCISDATPEGKKICKGANGNAFTFVGNTGTDTGVLYATYLTDNCTSTTVIPVTLTNCKTCTLGPLTSEVCKGPNGNAYDGNNDTGAPYNTYIAAFQAGGGNCE
jgi:hypothetical protein